MARTTPVHSGYTILNGAGTGTNGHRIDVWVEYKLGAADVSANATLVTAYFYAALNPNYTSTTAYAGGLNSQFWVGNTQAEGVTGGDYDFSSPKNLHLLGSFQGNIPHNADGTGAVTFRGSFTTRSAYISGGTLDKSVTLPPIPRAAQVAADGAVLGEKCCVRWTPASKNHSFSLTFTLGDWSAITPRINPATTDSVTYTGQVLPLEAARQFPGSTGQMTVTLTTYEGNRVLGTTTDTFSVTVPENNHTCPQVTAVLSPVCDPFPGKYVQRLGKVQAKVTALDPLGASITDITITDGSTITAGTLSAHLARAGAVTVTVTATNSRGFTGKFQQEITVLPYEAPRILQSQACRCREDGTPDPGGTHLFLDAQADCSPVGGSNLCVLRWRYKQDGGQFGDWQLLTPGVVPAVTLPADKAFAVDIEATDNAGSASRTQIPVPMEQVYLHRKPNALGLGGYAEGEGVLDLHWELRPRKGVGGLYLRTVTPENGSFQFRAAGNQGVLLFGYCGRPIRGLLGVPAEGSCTWEGTSGVSATIADRVVTVNLPVSASGTLALISPNPIRI